MVITLTRTAALSLDPLAEGSFSYGAQVGITTPTGIPVTIPMVGNCNFHVDTSPGTTSTAQLSGAITFPDSDRVQVATIVAGLEEDDFSITGIGGCALASAFLEVFVGTLAQTLERSVILCGAPGAALLVPCRES